TIRIGCGGCGFVVLHRCDRRFLLRGGGRLCRPFGAAIAVSPRFGLGLLPAAGLAALALLTPGVLGLAFAALLAVAAGAAALFAAVLGRLWGALFADEQAAEPLEEHRQSSAVLGARLGRRCGAVDRHRRLHRRHPLDRGLLDLDSLLLHGLRQLRRLHL